MKIALFGAIGTIGERIATQTLAHGHQVTAIVRAPARLALADTNLRVVGGDVLDTVSIAATVVGHDAVIGAIGPSVGDGDPQMLVQAAHALVEGLGRAGVKRLIVVAGAGSLEVAPGVRLVDTPNFPAAWKPLALAHADAQGNSSISAEDYAMVLLAEIEQPQFIRRRFTVAY